MPVGLKKPVSGETSADAVEAKKALADAVPPPSAEAAAMSPMGACCGDATGACRGYREMPRLRHRPTRA